MEVVGHGRSFLSLNPGLRTELSPPRSLVLWKRSQWWPGAGGGTGGSISPRATPIGPWVYCPPGCLDISMSCYSWWFLPLQKLTWIVSVTFQLLLNSTQLPYIIWLSVGFHLFVFKVNVDSPFFEIQGKIYLLLSFFTPTPRIRLKISWPVTSLLKVLISLLLVPLRHFREVVKDMLSAARLP